MKLLKRGRKGRAALAVVALAVVGPTFAPEARAETMRNVGGGVVTGTAIFDVGVLPPVTAGGCAQTLEFHLENATAPTFVFNTVFTGFVGEIDLTGTGKSLVCGTASTNFGELHLTVDGKGPTGSRVHCATLDGGYTRIGGGVVVTVSGNCVVNNFGTGVVIFDAALAFVPTPPGAGVTGPITQADFHGPFAIFPAES